MKCVLPPVQPIELLQIGIDREFQPAFVARLLRQASGQDGKRFADIVERNVDAALFLQGGAGAAPIAGQRLPVPDRRRAFDRILGPRDRDTMTQRAMQPPIKTPQTITTPSTLPDDCNIDML